ncbi:unnamed protein product, partial [Thelazia callipaeda]|uniref:Pre-mRNA-splicing factor SLU7 n=1 Tax=Thelazia callipaeda TaxID=103827 RepID=A0A0N5CKM1_THECL
NIPGKEKEAVKFAGENFVRYTGEVVQANEAQVFAWQARCKGIDVHALAEPTKLEAMKKEYEQQKVGAKDEQKSKLLEKYGGEEHLCAPPKELLLAQTENYVEYNRKGKVIKGEERSVIRSRYEEDKYINNHTTVWGSYWDSGQWGYACCHSFLRNSYCIGEAGKAKKSVITEIDTVPRSTSTDLCVKQDNNEIKTEDDLKESNSSSDDESSLSSSDSEVDPDIQLQMERERQCELQRVERDERRRKKRKEKRKRQKERRDKKKNLLNSSKNGNNDDISDNVEDEPKKELEKAIKKVNKDWEDAEESIQLGDRKRRYNSSYSINAPTEAEMEAYKLTAIHANDPMAAFMLEKRQKKHVKKD